MSEIEPERGYYREKARKTGHTLLYLAVFWGLCLGVFLAIHFIPKLFHGAGH